MRKLLRLMGSDEKGLFREVEEVVSSYPRQEGGDSIPRNFIYKNSIKSRRRDEKA